MFDIGLWELIVIGVIGLVVLGPERLPIAVKTVSIWIRTIRQMAQHVKSELEQELNSHDIDSDIKKAINSEPLNKDLTDNLSPSNTVKQQPKE